jgi:hypothetical protein
MARPDPAGDVPALRPPLVDPKAHRGLTSLGSLLIDDTVGQGQPTGRPCIPQPETEKPHPPSDLAKFPSIQRVRSNPADHAKSLGHRWENPAPDPFDSKLGGWSGGCRGGVIRRRCGEGGVNPGSGVSPKGESKSKSSTNKKKKKKKMPPLPRSQSGHFSR